MKVTIQLPEDISAALEVQWDNVQRRSLEAILLPIAIAEVDLGQHELVEEVLGVDVRACVAQYVTSVTRW